ncbi:thioredoxin domain-containing protein [Hyphomicrobiales bacterium]|jgi:uncharacterized protein YyaL (SSP411 family)|nr:thioredoxin domain-containing protein [Hyphomicrobiales bacterium]
MNQFSKNKNNLTNTLSPYLIQHSNNPVNWFPWVDEAFNIAQKDDIPILLSIGYSSCHWCHVMAHESFENLEIADLMNNLYVNIKVDREERPDIDNIYMSALHSIGEQGGWPLTMFLTPTGEPFWGGTYFPPVPKYGRPSFPSILKEISRIYCDEKDKVLSNANAIKEHISLLEFKKEQNTEDKFNINHFIKAFESITKQLDYEYGGLHSSQKFPNVEIIKLIQNNAISTNNKKLLSFIDLTLKNMCQGGIYDHLEGGFSRYTVDQKWLIPHFEKMLYDNSQIIEVLSYACQYNKNHLYKERVYQTIDWLLNNLYNKNGGFFSSIDADSENIEGKYYVWNTSELKNILGNEYTLFQEIYNVSEKGNWEGLNILNRLDEINLMSEETEVKIKKIREKLLQVRKKRIKPQIDDKILVDWNGITINSLAIASMVFKEKSWLEVAEKTYDLVTKNMSDSFHLKHILSEDATYNAFASDYGHMCNAAITLYEITNEIKYLKNAKEWIKILNDEFIHKNGGYYLSSKNNDLIIRPYTENDEAIPNYNSTIVRVMIKLYYITKDNFYLEKSRKIVQSNIENITKNPFYHASFLNNFNLLENNITLTFNIINAKRELLNNSWANYSFNTIRIFEENVPAINIENAKTYAIVCNNNCSLPIDNDTSLENEIKRRILRN